MWTDVLLLHSACVLCTAARTVPVVVQEVRRLDWGNATNHLLTQQYALAVAAAAAVYGSAMADVVQRWGVAPTGQGDAAGGLPTPALA